MNPRRLHRRSLRQNLRPVLRPLILVTTNSLRMAVGLVIPVTQGVLISSNNHKKSTLFYQLPIIK